jgi:sterol 24-C-methyltransferase
MGLKPGMRVLDAGCGIGGPSRSIAAFACVHVTGVSINNMQLARMKELTEEAGLTDRVVGVHGKFSGLDGVRLPFPDNHFDAVFSFESLCHAPDLKACYTELRRVCKPGGTLAFFEECITPLYDKSNTEHQEMVGRLERGGGLAHLPTAVDCRKALDEAGWKLEYDEDRALIPEYQVVPWYYPLDGDMRYPTARGDRMRTWLMKEGPWNVLRIMWKVLCTLHLCHPGRYEAITTCAQWVYGCRDAGKLGIFTPFHVFVAKNPQ